MPLRTLADHQQVRRLGHPVVQSVQQLGEQIGVLARLEAAHVADQGTAGPSAVALVQQRAHGRARADAAGQRDAGAHDVQPVGRHPDAGEPGREVLTDDAERGRARAEHALDAGEQPALQRAVTRPEAGHRQRVDGGRATRERRSRATQHAGLRLVGDQHRVLLAAEQPPEGTERGDVLDRGDLPDQGGEHRDPVGGRLRPCEVDVGIRADEQVVPQLGKGVDAVLDAALGATSLVAGDHVQRRAIEHRRPPQSRPRIGAGRGQFTGQYSR